MGCVDGESTLDFLVVRAPLRRMTSPDLCTYLSTFFSLENALV
jgi:hypothetical protein